MAKEKARDLRMVFFVRTDVDMPVGKVAAQVGHGVQYLMNANEAIEDNVDYEDWQEGHSVKIILEVDNADDLVEFYELGKRLGFPSTLITDKGFTVFEGDTLTVSGWGPIHRDLHHNYTSHLKLL